jgi:multimeric flavodoxin WrbA
LKDLKKDLESVKILGIAGSPRHGNTEILVKEALKSAESIGNVETSFLHIGGLKINPCNACFRCFEEGTNERPCPTHDDDMKMVYPKLIEADGLILGSPVYYGGISSQLKTMIDRTEPLVRYTKNLGGKLANKVGGAIVVGYNRNGGQETAIQMIHHFFLVHDMIIVGTGPEDTPGCYYGGSGVTYPKRSRIVNAVMDDELGFKSSRGVGRRVAEVAKLLKTGLGMRGR